MKIYTKTGDKGSTSLIGGERVGKNDLRVEAYGTVDELTAVIALLRDNMDAAEARFDEYREDLAGVLSVLMDVEAILASGSVDTGKKVMLHDGTISDLEKRIDYMSLSLKPVDSFTIPGGHPLVSLSHMCRTICRRAERRTVSTANEFEIEDNAVIYLNRLSDYLYQLGRKLADELEVEEELWKPQIAQ